MFEGWERLLTNLLGQCHLNPACPLRMRRLHRLSDRDGRKADTDPAGELLERSLANSAGVVACDADDQRDPAIMKQPSRNQSDCRQVSHRVRRSEWFMAR